MHSICMSDGGIGGGRVSDIPALWRRLQQAARLKLSQKLRRGGLREVARALDVADAGPWLLANRLEHT